MLYLPSMFGENLMDGFFDDFDNDFFDDRSPLYGKHAKNLMKTDVRERDNEYEIDVDLPGFKKDQIGIDLENGYLTISTNKSLSKDEKDQKGKLVRQELYEGSMARSFFIGEDYTEQDIKAKFEDGVLRLTLPKKNQTQEVPQKHTIMIED